MGPTNVNTDPAWELVTTPEPAAASTVIIKDLL